MDNPLEDLRKLTGVASKLSISTQGKECSRLQEEVSGFLAKQCLHALAAYQLANPIPRSDIDHLPMQFTVFDFSTLNCIVRVMFELHIGLCDVLYACGSDDELSFNLDLRELHGEAKRLHLLRAIDSPDAKTVEANVRQRIENVSKSDALDKLSEASRTTVANWIANDCDRFRNWKPLRWKDYGDVPFGSVWERARRYGYSDQICDGLYRHTSDDVHSGAFALSRVLQLDSVDDAKALCTYGIAHAATLLTRTVTDFLVAVGDLAETSFVDEETAMMMDEWYNYSRMDVRSGPFRDLWNSEPQG